MDFARRLNLLMNLLEISNSVLAKALSVDPSLISRWRTGARTPSKDSPYLDRIAHYVSHHAKLDFQKNAICSLIGVKLENLSEDEFSQILKSWLVEPLVSNAKLVEDLLSKIEIFKSPQRTFEKTDPILAGQKINCEVFYSIEGKRKGALKFFFLVAECKFPGELFLYSDEHISWFTEDKTYMLQLANAVISLAKLGWKVNMVHTVSRDVSEMMKAIEFWLPLYMTGSVAPYYNPRYREHYFRRTLFVAPKVAAFLCTTFEESQKETPSFLFTEQQIIDLMAMEYERFLKSCQPLMIIPQIGSEEMFSLLERFEEQPMDGYIISDGLPLVTMPGSVLEKILKRNHIEPDQIFSHWRKRSTSFEKNLKSCHQIHVCTMPDLEKVRSGKMIVELPESSFELHYDEDEYVEHLASTIEFIKKYENYGFYLSQRNVTSNVLVSVKDQTGVIVIKKDSPIRLFAINQPDMTNAFYCYAEDFIHRLPQQCKDRSCVIEQLELVLKELL
ncbi:hypothetical protein [Pseudothermotoga sp.]|uniref:hypothetical protein n=1 Tax=Pseudothermotoga sp. TaxID=2033661 RepID=UPI0031F6C820